jgi:hypothetical protein
VLRTHRDLAAIQIYTDLLRSAHRPVVLVDYLRDAFILPYNQIRVTFDQYVRTQSIPCSLYQPDLARLPNQAQDMVIMEIKFQHRLPPWFAQVVSPSSAIHMAISKYCAGRIPQMDFYHEHAIISQ